MKTNWAPLLLLAAAAPAAANSPAAATECDVLVSVVEDRPLPARWEDEMADRLRGLGFKPEWACVVVPDADARVIDGVTLTESDTGTLVETCTTTRTRTSCGWTFEKKEVATASDGEVTHIQIHGSDFNSD